jgi:ribonuclease Z
VSGWNAGRSEPMRLYGPIGEKPEFGIKHFADRQIETFPWDRSTRESKMPPNGAKVDVTEIDYSQAAEVYNENGAKISIFPALHGEGSISYRLERNGLVLVYSGDTAPNQFMIDNARGADILIHETFNPPEQITEAFGLPVTAAEFIATFIHSIPDQAGYVAEQCNPRLFVGLSLLQQ